MNMVGLKENLLHFLMNCIKFSKKQNKKKKTYTQKHNNIFCFYDSP